MSERERFVESGAMERRVQKTMSTVEEDGEGDAQNKE